MYGPTTALLVSIFPPHERFIVKPQAPLRPSFHSRSSSVIGLHSGSPSVPYSPRDSDVGSDVMSDIPEDLQDVQFPSSRNLAPITPPRPVHPISHLWKQLNDADDSKSIDSYDENVFSRNTRQSNKGVGYIDFVCVKATEELDQGVVLSALELKRDDEDLVTRELQFGNYLDILETKAVASDFKGFLIRGDKTELSEMFEGRSKLVREMVTMGPEMQHLLHNLAAAHRNSGSDSSDDSEMEL